MTTDAQEPSPGTPPPDSDAAKQSSTSWQLDLRILRALRRIIQAVDIHSRKLASQYQITAPQLVTLLCVIEQGPITTSEIARQVHLSNSTVVGILDRLETKGLVFRERGTTDRQLGETAPSPLQDVFAEALHKLPELEQTAIALSLERIVDLMEARGIDAAPMLQLGEMNTSEDTRS